MFGLIRNASVAIKVALPPMFVIVCLALVGGIGFVANEKLSSSIVVLGQITVPNIVQVTSMSEQISVINSMVNQSLAWEGAGYKAKKLRNWISVSQLN